MLVGKLTPLQVRFCEEYLVDLNATKAAVRAGYSPKTANEQGARLLANVSVAAHIAKLKEARSERTQITADRVLQELWGMATADTNELIEHRVCCCRYCHGEGFRFQRTPEEMHSARARWQAMAAASEDEEATPPFDEQGGVGYNTTKDPHPDCPECFGMGVGVPVFRDSRKASAQAQALYAGVKVTRNGMEMKLHDKSKALELLGRHLGIFEKDNSQKKFVLNVGFGKDEDD